MVWKFFWCASVEGIMLALHLVFLITLFTLSNWLAHSVFGVFWFPLQNGYFSDLCSHNVGPLWKSFTLSPAAVFNQFVMFNCEEMRTLHRHSTWRLWLHTEARKPCGCRQIQPWLVYSRSCYDKVFENCWVWDTWKGLVVDWECRCPNRLSEAHIRNIRLLMGHSALWSYCTVKLWMYYIVWLSWNWPLVTCLCLN